MQKTSKVTDILQVKPWQGPKGTVYYFSIELANGDKGEIGSKSDDGIKIGDELNYTLEQTEHGFKIKKAYQQNGFGGGGFKGQQRGSSASFALSYAKDLAVANISKADKPMDMSGVTKRVLDTADEFQKWLKENE
jgi:hypothetical protein